MKGTEGAGIVLGLAPEPDDLVLPKTTYSGFQNSNLEPERQFETADEAIESWKPAAPETAAE